MPQGVSGAPIDTENRCAYTRDMLTKDAIAHFGSQAALARALGIEQPSVAGWKETVPPLRQLQLERMTGGALKADPQILTPIVCGKSPHRAAA